MAATHRASLRKKHATSVVNQPAAAAPSDVGPAADDTTQVVNHGQTKAAEKLRRCRRTDFKAVDKEQNTSCSCMRLQPPLHAVLLLCRCRRCCCCRRAHTHQWDQDFRTLKCVIVNLSSVWPAIADHSIQFTPPHCRPKSAAARAAELAELPLEEQQRRQHQRERQVRAVGLRQSDPPSWVGSIWCASSGHRIQFLQAEASVQ